MSDESIPDDTLEALAKAASLANDYAPGTTDEARRQAVSVLVSFGPRLVAELQEARKQVAYWEKVAEGDSAIHAFAFYPVQAVNEAQRRGEALPAWLIDAHENLKRGFRHARKVRNEAAEEKG